MIKGDNKLASKPLVIGKTPNIFAICDKSVNADNDLVITKKIIEKCMRPELRDETGKRLKNSGHYLTEKQLAKALDNLKKPVMVLKGSLDNTFVAVTDFKDNKGKEIIIAIEYNKVGDVGKINSVSSAYGKDNFPTYIKDNIKKNNLIAVNIEKANKMLLSIGVDFPKANTFISFDNSIAYSMTNVNYPKEKILENKGDERSMTEQQMLEQIEALRREFEEKFSGMEEKFNSLSSEVQTINKFVAAMTEAQGFEQTMSEIESVTKQLTGCEEAVFYCYDNAAGKFFSGGEAHRNLMDTREMQDIKSVFDSGEIIRKDSAAMIPLISSKGETVGVIAAEKEKGFTASDLEHFKQGSQIVSTAELALNKEFEHQGRVTDELT
ncbi:MAG: hypothetical protein NC120_04945 [Ruminococcus sp.]|nr:hypothetical protein [Ruminococcus sp.]